MNLIIRAIHKMHGLIGKDPVLSVENRKEIDFLKDKVLNGKKNDLKKLKKTNGEIKVMIERGEFSFKIVK